MYGTRDPNESAVRAMRAAWFDVVTPLDDVVHREAQRCNVESLRQNDEGVKVKPLRRVHAQRKSQPMRLVKDTRKH